MTRYLLIALLLPLPALAQTQGPVSEWIAPSVRDQPADLESGANAPAASSQLPPSIPPGNRFQGPEGPVPAPRLLPGFQPEVAPDPLVGGAIRLTPGPGHQTMPAPAVPGATRPETGEGFFTNRDVIPPHVGEGPSLSEVPPVTR